MLISYDWLQSYFDKKLPKPEEVAEALSLHSLEIEGLEKAGGDYVIDVDVLPNRAHDCLSHIGIARELSVILNLKLKEKELSTNHKPPARMDVHPGGQTPKLEIEVENKEKCRRYIGLEINNIQVGPSPEWLKKRLEAVGQKSINNVVDAINYVMLSLGQPLHAFDADKLKSKKIVIRDAENGEMITLLTGEEVALKEGETLVISDEFDALAIAGVKGGTRAEIDENTKNIILESANFDPVSIRKTSRALGIHTDSSKRFEREITPDLAGKGMDEAVKLILEIAKTPETEVKEAVDIYPKPVESWSISVSVDEINNLLGTKLKAREITDIFNRFGFEYKLIDADKKLIDADKVFEVEIPSYRLDLKIKEDLIEEIGRIYGYGNIDSVLPEPAQSKINKEFYYITKIRNILTKEGFSEVYMYSFVDKGKVEIQNPLAKDKKFLRSNLDKLSESLNFNSRNEDLLGLESTKIFEIGTVFDGEGEEHIALGFSTNGVEKQRQEIVELLLKELGLNQRIEPEIHADVFEINISELIEKLPEPTSYDDLNVEVSKKEITYKAFSPYPVILRDIAVWVLEDTEEIEVRKVIKDNTGELLVTEPRLFDEFSKGGRTSYAYRLVFQSYEKTLFDGEINDIMDKITEKIEANKGWDVR